MITGSWSLIQCKKSSTSSYWFIADAYFQWKQKHPRERLKGTGMTLEGDMTTSMTLAEWGSLKEAREAFEANPTGVMDEGEWWAIPTEKVLSTLKFEDLVGTCGVFLTWSDGERKPGISRPESDRINSPAHYTSHPSGIECIDVVEHMSFCAGNAVKYLWRAGLKDGSSRKEDLAKAEWYIRREIARFAKIEGGGKT